MSHRRTGLGFALQMIRAEDAGRPFVVRHAWRSALLLAIGLVHASVIGTGDILRTYAMLGMLLLVGRRWHPRVLVAVALAFLVLVTSDTLEFVTPGRFMMRADPEQARSESERTIETGWAHQARVTPAVQRLYKSSGAFLLRRRA